MTATQHNMFAAHWAETPSRHTPSKCLRRFGAAVQPSATLCVMAVCTLAIALLQLTSTGTAHAQSLQDLIGQTGRTVQKSLRSVDRALTQSAGGSSRRSNRNRQRNVALPHPPPLPVRQPKPWHNKTTTTTRTTQPGQAVRPVTKVPQQSTRIAPPARISSEPPKRAVRKARLAKPSPNPNDEKSWPKTLDEVKAEKAAKDKPDVWPQIDINIAKARCTHLLKQVNAEVVFQDPIKRGPCGDPAPVKLHSLGIKPKVAISPPALINCNMVYSLHEWLEKDLQPLARKHLGEEISTLVNMSSYSCRNAYGRTSTRLSEHGRANALDIRGFKTKSGKTAYLLEHWGPNNRDFTRYKVALRKYEKQKAEQARALAAAEAEKKRKRIKKVNHADGDVVVRKSIIEGVGTSDSVGIRGTVVPIPDRGVGFTESRLGGPKKKTGKKTAALPLTKLKAPTPVDTSKMKTPKARFLREAHKRACKIFGTTLGPEANNAHKNHFHVDLAPRKRSNFCE